MLFGAATVGIRVGLRRAPDAVFASLVTGTVALVVALAAALAFARDLGGVWPFALAGILAPGTSQVLFVAAVGMAGASRVSVVVGTAPLVAGLIAIVFLDEPVRAGLVVGALLIVVGGVALISERVRPEDFRAAGALLAGTACMAGFQLVRGLPSRGTAARSFRALAPAGVLFGLSYLALFAAYNRGRVTVVSPLVATESLWGVLISVLLLRSSELVGRRLVAGALLVVVGGVLIGLAR